LRFEELVFFGNGFQPGGSLIVFRLTPVLVGVFVRAGLLVREAGLDCVLVFGDAVERLVSPVGFVADGTGFGVVVRLVRVPTLVRELVDEAPRLAGGFADVVVDSGLAVQRVAGLDEVVTLWVGLERVVF
jgi:hypothetical protein